MQMESLECGAACLAMVLAYYGLWLPLEQLRIDCGVSRDGQSARRIKQAAQLYGLQVEARKYEPERFFEMGTFPAITFMGFDHFVVVTGVKGDIVYINDPSGGRKKLAKAEFDEQFTGVALFFTPGLDFEPSGKRASTLAFLKDKLEGSRSALILTALITAITSAILFIQPAFARVFMDLLLSGQAPGLLLPFIVLFVIVACFALVASYIKAIYLLKMEGKLAVSANTSFFWHVLHLPMEFFSQRMAGDLILRQDANATAASVAVNTLGPLLINGVMMIAYLYVLFTNSALLAIIGLIAVAINLITAQIISTKRMEIMGVMRRETAKKTGIVMNGIRTISSIKASGAENSFFNVWADSQATEYTQRAHMDKINTYLGSIPELVSSLTDAVVIGTGVVLCFQGDFTVGMLLAFMGFLAQFRAPVAELISAGQSIQESRVDMERIEDVMSYEMAIPDEAQPTTDDIELLSGGIEIEGLTFGYGRFSPPVIEDFNLAVEAGKSVAIVGESGCGKSTVAKLITGLYEPWSGEISFDGKTRSDIARSVLINSIAMVDQEITLFADSVRNNIAMWNEGIEDPAIVHAAKDAQLHEDIMKLPGGYSYKIAEGGRDLSGGQRQRLEIARVLALDSPIIILDEATSALDAVTEREVVEGIKERGATCIIVAHRLSTIRDCDEIIVLKAGRVVERGTHEELFAQGGEYTKLISNE